MLHFTFCESARSWPDKLAVVADGRRVTYAQLHAEVRRLAQVLQEAGAKPRDRICMLLPNTVAAAAAVWAILDAGCTLVPLHATARKSALHAVLRDADPLLVVTSQELLSSVLAVREVAPASVGVIVLAPPAKSGDFFSWELCVPAPLGTPPSVNAAQLESSSSTHQLAALLYTSGSTGEPKGVMLTHANMIAALRAVNCYLELNANDILFSALPLSSSYGLYQLVSALWLGATLVLERSFAFPAKSLHVASEEKATVFAGVPTMYAWMAMSKALPNCDLSSLRILTSAAASLPVEHARRVRALIPSGRLFVMYGQTECKRISYLPPEDLDRKPGSVGRGMPFQDLLVVDEYGNRVPAGAIGELVVRGPHVMQGYWRRPVPTAERLRPLREGGEPWLHTNDIFRIDEDGYLYFVSRKDDLLKIGGHKVSPRDIEEVLCELEGVREAAVVGVPDRAWGQAAKAYVLVREGATIQRDDVVRHCSLRLQGFMIPKVIEFVGELPRTESGKIKKSALA